MSITAIIPLIEIGAKLIDKLIPDKEAAAKAKLDLIALEQQGQLEELRTRMSAILAEAQSADPWTSRARPSFLYVVYLLILFSLPMGFLSAISPETATQVSAGFSQWLSALPESLTDLFTFVMLGYIGGRSWEKVKGVPK
jgi:hypothetical protein